MILTEDDAKLKRCQESFPAAEGLSYGGLAEYRTVYTEIPKGDAYISGRNHQTAPINCIGAQCMAWRWMESDGRKRGVAYARGEAVKGYCGKAGKP